MNIAKILRAPIFKKICKQLFLQFVLLPVKISQRLPSTLNSISLFSSRSSSKFKKFSLGCSVVDSSLIRKKEELAEIATGCRRSLSFVVTGCTTRCHSLSLVVIRCHSLYHLLSLVVTRCHALSLDVPLICLFIFLASRLSFQFY